MSRPTYLFLLIHQKSMDHIMTAGCEPPRFYMILGSHFGGYDEFYLLEYSAV
jgi:hypothetical protein